VSAQWLAEQLEFAAHNRMPFPIISDDQFVLAAALSLPTFAFDGARFYKRLALAVPRHATQTTGERAAHRDRHRRLVGGIDGEARHQRDAEAAADPSSGATKSR